MADKSLKDLASAVYKIAEKTEKNIQPDVKDIRDVICGTGGLLESVISINTLMDGINKRDTIDKMLNRRKDPTKMEKNQKKLLKGTDSIVSILEKILANVKKIQGGKGGVSDKVNARNLKKESKLDEKNKRLDGISKSIEIIERLRNLKLKDFLFAKTKLKHIGKIMNKSLRMFRMFKNAKEMDKTVEFVFSSIEIVKKLAKISILSKPAQWGEKAIEKIFLGKTGKGGLLQLFRRIDRNRVTIIRGRRTIKALTKACGSMLLATLALTGIAVTALPAMLGALLMKGVVALLIPTFRKLSRSGRVVRKGSVALLIMSAAIITFSLGLGLMVHAVKNMNLKDLGFIVASIIGVSLAYFP